MEVYSRTRLYCYERDRIICVANTSVALSEVYGKTEGKYFKTKYRSVGKNTYIFTL